MQMVQVVDWRRRMSSYQPRTDIQTLGRGTTQITAEVARIVRASGIATGIAHGFVQHKLFADDSENADPSVRSDLETLATRWTPDGDSACWHDSEGDDDMAAHARSVLTGSWVTLRVACGELLLGTSQGIYLWEHRAGSHTRSIVVTVVG